MTGGPTAGGAHPEAPSERPGGTQGREPDPALRRLERNALIVCAGAAAAAFLIQGGDPAVSLGVLGGGFLIGASYWAIKSGVDGLVLALAPGTHVGEAEAPRAPARRRTSAWLLARFVLRHALLVVLAYVMIARLRLHPVGLLVGASSVLAALALEVVRGSASRIGGRR